MFDSPPPKVPAPPPVIPPPPVEGSIGDTGPLVGHGGLADAPLEEACQSPPTSLLPKSVVDADAGEDEEDVEDELGEEERVVFDALREQVHWEAEGGGPRTLFSILAKLTHMTAAQVEKCADVLFKQQASSKAAPDSPPPGPPPGLLAARAAAAAKGDSPVRARGPWGPPGGATAAAAMAVGVDRSLSGGSSPKHQQHESPAAQPQEEDEDEDVEDEDEAEAGGSADAGDEALPEEQPPSADAGAAKLTGVQTWGDMVEDDASFEPAAEEAAPDGPPSPSAAPEPAPAAPPKQPVLSGPKLKEWLRAKVYQLRVDVGLGINDLISVLEGFGEEQLQPPYNEAKLWLGFDESEPLPSGLEKLLAEYSRMRSGLAA